MADILALRILLVSRSEVGRGVGVYFCRLTKVTRQFQWYATDAAQAGGLEDEEISGAGKREVIADGSG